MDEGKKQYFKIDKGIAEISNRSLSEKALKVYILHCLRANTKKNLGCSLAGANDAKKYAGIPDKLVYEKALKELQDKHFIKLRDDVKTGYLKAMPVEILTFPTYDAKNRQFKKVKGLEHDHRTYHPGQYLNIPTELINIGMLKKLNADTLLIMFKLYAHTDIKAFGGVDPRFIHCYNDKFPKGYKPFKQNESLSEVVNTTTYQYSGIISCPLVNDLISKGVFGYKRALVYKDPNDPEYMYVINFLKESESGGYTIPTPKNSGQIVIDILYPRYCVDEYFKGIDSS